MAKIKVCSPHFSQLSHLLTELAQNELAVDDFLEADDSRMVAEGLVLIVYSIEQSIHTESPDITDRFDFTFLFGDLNFRLDLSRLHADWLISRRGRTIKFPTSFIFHSNGIF
jgi:hypothetical protein